MCSFQITWETTLRQISLADGQFFLHIYFRTKFNRTSQVGFKFLQNMYPKNIVNEVFSLKVFLGASRTKDLGKISLKNEEVAKKLRECFWENFFGKNFWEKYLPPKCRYMYSLFKNSTPPPTFAKLNF